MSLDDLEPIPPYSPWADPASPVYRPEADPLSGSYSVSGDPLSSQYVPVYTSPEPPPQGRTNGPPLRVVFGEKENHSPNTVYVTGNLVLSGDNEGVKEARFLMRRVTGRERRLSKSVENLEAMHDPSFVQPIIVKRGAVS